MGTGLSWNKTEMPHAPFSEGDRGNRFSGIEKRFPRKNLVRQFTVPSALKEPSSFWLPACGPC